MQPQEDMGLHDHPYVELVLITAGAGTHLAADQRLPLDPGDVFVVPPGMPHGYADCEALELFNVCFDPVDLGLPLSRLSRLPGYQTLFAIEPRLRSHHGFAGHLHLGRDQLDPLVARVAELRTELLRRDPGHDLQGLALLQQLLIQLSRIAQQRRGEDAADLLRLGELLAWIDHRLATGLDVERIARRAAVSTATLQRWFRSRLGLSVNDYLITLRMERARELLLRDDLPIAAIAARVGIADPNYFTRAFRARHGQAPRDWRRTRRADR